MVDDSGVIMRSHFLLIVCGAPVALAAACASIPAAPLAPDRSAATWRARTLDDPALRAYAAGLLTVPGQWPPAQWDAANLTLAALWFRPELATAIAQARAAGAASLTAARLPNPTVSLTPLRVANAGPGVAPWMISTSLIGLIGIAHKREHRIAVAEAGAEEARLNALWTARGIEIEVKSAVVAATAARRRMDLLAEQSSVQAEVVDIAEKRVAAGIASRLELSAARTSLTRSEADRLAAERSMTEARHRLAAAVSVPVETLPLERITRPLELEDASDETFAALSARARDAAVLGRADLMAALAAYAGAEAALRLEIAKQYPDIEFGPSYEFDQGEHMIGLSVGAVLPVFDRNEGPIAEAKEKREVAAAQFLVLQASAISGADRATAALREADAALRTARGLAGQQRARLRSAEALYHGGESDRLSLLAARIEVAVADLVESDAVATRADARLALEVAAGDAASELDLGRAVTARAAGVPR